MSLYGRKLLMKMFEVWQSNSSEVKPITLPITRSRALAYFEAENLDSKSELHAFLKTAEFSGCVALKWGRFAKSHLLERISLLDGEKLGAFLGVPLASKQALSAEHLLRPTLSGKHIWIVKLLEEMLEHWRLGKSAFGLNVEQEKEAKELLLALEAVSDGRQDGCDMRTFSARYVGDSKSMERMQSRFSRIWQRQFCGDDLDPDELYESLGISKFPHPFLFKGPISVVSSGNSFDCSMVRPYIGFPPQAIEQLEFPELPSYVLTIENLASFNRYVAEIQDRGLVIYTGGFPSSSKANLFRTLDTLLSETINFYHWGDLDLGGLRIAIRIQSFLRRNIHLHLMNRELLEQYGEMNDNISREKLLKLSAKHNWITPYVDFILSFERPRTLEQENVDPETPKHATKFLVMY